MSVIITFLPVFTFPEFPLDSRNRFLRWTSSRENAITNVHGGSDSIRYVKRKSGFFDGAIQGKIEHLLSSTAVTLSKVRMFPPIKHPYGNEHYSKRDRIRLFDRVFEKLDLTAVVKLNDSKLVLV